MLYNILNKLKIKDHNKFLAVLFGVFTLVIIAFVLVQFVTLIFGDARLDYLPDPIAYALALICPVICYSYAVNTKLISGKDARIKWFMITVGIFGAIIASLLITNINKLIWMLLEKVPNYALIKSEYPELFAPAIKTISFVVPFIGIFYMIDYFLLILRDDDINKGIAGFCGLSVKKPKTDKGIFTCENIICKDVDTLQPVVVSEKKRMEATLVQGATGTGKTATVLLPMSARDLEKKYFLREYSKKLAFGLLKRGIAYIEGPYSNEYINLNFSLNYILPKKGKEKEFYKELEDLILYKNESTGEVVYRNVGITVVENDGKYVSDFTNVAKNFDIEVLTIDPTDPEHTLSMNPFAIEDPAKVASIIADVLKSMQQSEGAKEEAFFANLTSDAFQNLSILLKEMYPRLHNGELPSLEDVLDLLYNFDKVEEMTEDMKKIPELADKYKLLIAYFEKNFYKPSLNINGFEIPGTRGSGRKDTERYLYGAITQLNNLLRHPGIKKALCGRHNVIDFDKALKEGHVITACSRKGELGIIASKAFGMFFILQFQDAVLRRPGSEDSRIPNFLFIDEFPEYINKDTEVMFTLFRKYRCGAMIAIQNLSQLEKHKGMEYYRQVVLANTKTQIVFGDTTPEDSEYWNKAFGMAKKVDMSSSFDPTGGDFKAKKSVQYKDKERFKVHKIAEHKFGYIYYRTKLPNGNSVFGEGKVGFLEDKFKQKHPAYMYNFEKFMINKPVSSDVSVDTNTSKSSTAYIMEEDNDNIFGTASNEPITNEQFLENPMSSQELPNKDTDNPPVIMENDDLNDAIKTFDFNNDDDFDIVIDTGSDKKD
ncbi:MAG: TraM recognition domain-containing protein [Clostridia bacterium]|nr:TraM recognition domain-containing protein [Clostridia bacterium]